MSEIIRDFIGKGFVNQIELEKFRRKILPEIGRDEKTFLEFHRCESLEEYLLKQKFAAIEWSIDGTLPSTMRRRVVRVMLKLPFDVVDNLAYKLLDEVIYVDSSTVIKLPSKPGFMVILYEPDFAENVSEERKRYTIAHELAHVYLKHDLTKEERYLFQYEDEANKLAKSWGFKKPEGWQEKVKFIT